MITIEEKMKLFTKIVYDKIEKYNQSAVTNFNIEYGNIIEERKKEFQKEAERIYSNGIKDIQKEKLQILSKARVEEKKIILNMRKQLFEETINELKKYAKVFVETGEYKNIFLSDLTEVLREINSSGLEAVMTHRDHRNFSKELENCFSEMKVEFIYDDELIGGFVLIDRTNNIRIDMSIINRIESSRELIGERLFAILQ